MSQLMELTIVRRSENLGQILSSDYLFLSVRPYKVNTLTL